MLHAVEARVHSTALKKNESGVLGCLLLNVRFTSVTRKPLEVLTENRGEICRSLIEIGGLSGLEPTRYSSSNRAKGVPLIVMLISFKVRARFGLINVIFGVPAKPVGIRNVAIS